MKEKRIALLIGNQSYGNFETLTTPDKDVKRVGEMLKKLGFETDCRNDQSASDFYDSVQDTIDKLGTGVASLVFYYAGHGCSVDGNEYLIPVDGKNAGFSKIVAQSFVEIKMVIDLFSASRKSFEVPIIFILDCCRVELGLGGNRSAAGAEVHDLSSLGNTVNIYIMYSTARGYTASDGGKGNENGAYTEYLLKHLGKARTISELSTEVRRDLYNDPRYKNMQVAFASDSLLHPYHLASVPLTSTDASFDACFGGEGAKKYRKVLVGVNMNGKFIGRTKELEILDKLLKGPSRNITVHGFGGIGKTALALEAARNFDSGGVLALPLAGTPTLSQVIRKIARFLNIDIGTFPDLESQQDEVIASLENEETILLFLDNVEDIKQSMETGNEKQKTEAEALMRFFRQLPVNVKMLATSRIALGWFDEQLVQLDGLAPHDGAEVFRQWIPHRRHEIDNYYVLKLSSLINGHSLSLRLLGSMFNNSKEPLHQFIDNISERLPKATDTLGKRHKSINTCINYSFDYIGSALRLLLGFLRVFEVPFTAALVAKAFYQESSTSSESSIQDDLHVLWQHSWLNRLMYKEDQTLGDWLPRIIKQDSEFYTLHPRLREFLYNQAHNIDVGIRAVHDNPEIAFYTALCYGVGFGVMTDLERQIEWCIKAGINGNLEAQLTLAACYEQGGCGVTQNQKEAFRWYLMAAEAGDKVAQKKVYECYFYGTGVERDHEEYIYWLGHHWINKEECTRMMYDLSLPRIHRACEQGQMEQVRWLIEQQMPNMQLKDTLGRTPLHCAAESGHVELVKLLVEEFGADVVSKDKNGSTPLHVAAANGNVEMVKLLAIKFGAGVNEKDKKGKTALFWATINGYADKMNFLISELGANIVTTLDLNFENLGDEGARALAKSLKQNMTITALKLIKTEIGSGGAKALAELLKENKTLAQLSLGSNNIGFEGAKALAESLKENKTLTQLSLELNNIGSEGAKALAEALKENTTLTQLYLGSNNVDSEGAKALAEALKENTTLTKLYLGSNNVDSEGAKALAEALKENTALTQLQLYTNNVDSEGAKALAESLKENTTLTQLNLNVNKIDSEGVKALAESLKTNTTLTQLSLFSNKIGSEEKQVLNEFLSRNRTLIQL